MTVPAHRAPITDLAVLAAFRASLKPAKATSAPPWNCSKGMHEPVYFRAVQAFRCASCWKPLGVQSPPSCPKCRGVVGSVLDSLCDLHFNELPPIDSAAIEAALRAGRERRLLAEAALPTFRDSGMRFR